VKTCATCGAEWPDDTRFCPSDGSPLRPAEGTSLIGGVIDGKFHIIEKLGEGGMGAVYLGEHVKMGRKSAIKVLTKSLAQDTEAIARFNREAANAARITHPNVCAIYDFGETQDGLIYLAMEFIEGESLTDLLRREGPLGPYRAATLISQAGDALQAAHHLGIVHRDLKPDNIMIAQGRTGEDVVKVVDFGIAKAMGGEEGQQVTRTGLVVGTPEYMSPEQLSGDVLDGRSDIYSLALVLYKMLTGRLPFEAESAQEMMIKRLTDEPLSLNDALPGGKFPAELQDVVDRALQRMPTERYSNASEFARDVVKAVARQPAGASIDSDGATQLLGTAPSTPVSGKATEQLPKTRISAAKPTIPMEDLKAGGKGKLATPETPMPGKPVTLAAEHRKKGKKTPVMAIAASAVIVVGGGMAALLALVGNGEGGLVSEIDSLQQVANPPAESGAVVPERLATNNQMGNPAGGRQDDRTRVAAQGDTQSGGAGSADSAGQVDPVRVVDDGAIEQELIDLGRAVEEPAQAAGARARLMEIFDMASLSAVLKGRAASVLSLSYETTDMTQACRWIDRAIELEPGNDTYRRVKQDILSCQP